MKKEKICHEVPPIPSEDYEIVREESEDGTITYRHPSSGKIDTGTMELDLFVGCMNERYQSLIALLSADDYVAFGIILEALVAYNMRQLHEMLEFMSRSIGKIDFHYINVATTSYRPGRVVGMSIEPPQVFAARMAKAEGVAR